MTQPLPGLDVLAFGEALLRLQPEGDVRLEEAQRLALHVGGAELNSCCALAAPLTPTAPTTWSATTIGTPP